MVILPAKNYSIYFFGFASFSKCLSLLFSIVRNQQTIQETGKKIITKRALKCIIY